MCGFLVGCHILDTSDPFREGLSCFPKTIFIKTFSSSSYKIFNSQCAYLRVFATTTEAREPERRLCAPGETLRAMATSGYLRGHDFYALARRASEPGSANAIPVTGFLNYDARMLEGLETVDADVRALGVMMTSSDEELEAVDANLPPVLGYTDGRGRIRPGFRVMDWADCRSRRRRRGGARGEGTLASFLRRAVCANR